MRKFLISAALAASTLVAAAPAAAQWYPRRRAMPMAITITARSAASRRGSTSLQRQIAISTAATS